MKVTACLVTRGDVDMSPILNTLPYDEILVWDNSERDDLGIYGRYALIAEATHDVIYTQDDDLLVTCHQELLDAYEGGLLVNYPEPWDVPWVARGSLFHRDLPYRAFDLYEDHHPFDRFFTHSACDGIFGLLTPRVKVVDFGSVDLPHGFADGRVSTSPGWYDGARPELQRRCAEIKGGHRGED